MGLLIDRINNKLENSNVINEYALSREPVPLRVPSTRLLARVLLSLTLLVGWTSMVVISGGQDRILLTHF